MKNGAARDDLSAWRNDVFQDEGSEISEAASEGSSASSTFCALEKDYSKVRTGDGKRSSLGAIVRGVQGVLESNALTGALR